MRIKKSSVLRGGATFLLGLSGVIGYGAFRTHEEKIGFEGAAVVYDQLAGGEESEEFLLDAANDFEAERNVEIVISAALALGALGVREIAGRVRSEEIREEVDARWDAAMAKVDAKYDTP